MYICIYIHMYIYIYIYTYVYLQWYRTVASWDSLLEFMAERVEVPALGKQF